MDVVSVIQFKKIVGAVKKPDEGTTVWLYRVFGVATGMRPAMLANGDAMTKFRGDFIAQTLVPVGREQEIRTHRAEDLNLPTVAEEMAVAEGVGEDGKFSEFGMKIGITLDKGKTAPRFVAEWVSKPTQSSPAERLVREHAPEILGAAPAASQAPAAPAKSGGKGR